MDRSVKINWYVILSGVVLSLLGYVALDFTGLYYIGLAYFDPPMKPLDDSHQLMNYMIAFFSMMIGGAAIAFLGIIRIFILDLTASD